MNSIKKNIVFDIYYDFREDCGGKDPDSGSPTLRRYHRILWSKKQPNGEMMQLTHDRGGYLKWKDFEFASDQMANGLYFKRAKKLSLNSRISSGTMMSLLKTMNIMSGLLEERSYSLFTETV